MAQDNKTLGNFQLDGIAPARRGVPQIEVTFDIDVNGIVHVTAVDKATNKKQSITITNSSGLSEDEIDRMVKEAQAHEAEDKKQKETVEIRNRADSAVYQAEKAIKDLGDKVDKAKADEVQAAADKVKEALKGTDTDAIKKATEELEKPLYEMSAAAYQQAGGPEAAAGASAAPGAGAADAGAKSEDDNVVDAEYTEVKDDKK